MQKIGDITDTADSNGEFTDGNVAGNVQPTELMAAWFTTIQRELIAVLNEADISPDKANDAQLAAAIKSIIDSGIAGSGYLISKNNLSDLDDASISRGHLGLGGLATKDGLTASDVGAYPVDGGEVKGEAWSAMANNYRIISGQKGAFWRFDGSNYYLMFTNADDQHGGYNGLRPLNANAETGDLSTGHNFTASGNVTAGNNVYSGSGASWLATDGNVYGACWGGYLNNWIASQINAGQASRVASVGLGARVLLSNLNSAGDWSAQIPIGAVLIAALTVGDDRITNCYYSYLMYNINGNWVNTGQVG